MSSHIAPIKTYLAIWIALMVLLALTIGAAFIHMGHLNLAITLLIAGIKAAMVVLYFMHVRWSSRLTWVFASAAVLWLGILFVLSVSDYTTRGAMPEQRAIAPAIVPPDQGLPIYPLTQRPSQAPPTTAAVHE